MLSVTDPVRLETRTISVNLKKNNRLRPRPGRFGFLTEPDLSELGPRFLFSGHLVQETLHLKVFAADPMRCFCWGVSPRKPHLPAWDIHAYFFKLTPMVRLETREEIRRNTVFAWGLCLGISVDFF